MKKLLFLNIGVLVILSLAFTACQKVNELADQFKKDRKKKMALPFTPWAVTNCLSILQQNPKKL